MNIDQDPVFGIADRQTGGRGPFPVPCKAGVGVWRRRLFRRDQKLPQGMVDVPGQIRIPRRVAA